MNAKDINYYILYDFLIFMFMPVAETKSKLQHNGAECWEDNSRYPRGTFATVF